MKHYFIAPVYVGENITSTFKLIVCEGTAELAEPQPSEDDSWAIYPPPTN